MNLVDAFGAEAVSAATGAFDKLGSNQVKSLITNKPFCIVQRATVKMLVAPGYL
jgi:hypothetical protein